MTRPVTVGLNGTRASDAAADWGAREADLRMRPLRLVSAWEWQPYSHAPLTGTETPEQWSRRLPGETAARLAKRYPHLVIEADQLTGPPPEMLCRAAAGTELLALGTAGLGALRGFFLGSVAMATVAHAHRPVVLVRPDSAAPGPAGDDGGVGEQAAAPVVAGIDLGPTTDGVLRFAFEAAAVRAAGVEIQYCWNPPVGYVQGIGGDLRWRTDIAEEGMHMVRSLLAPWSQKYPRIAVRVRCEIGSPARHLVDAGAHASLIAVGRRTNRYWPHEPRIGHVAHAVLHHSPAPVAVVPQD
ncbi:universal stress protein [Streptomyces sp. NPDC057521]|uniref:universal stress protein n=1 Tax=Streptomyces sp. NPDC057521 TaxID=3346156 RepID=UPI0036C2BEFD